MAERQATGGPLVVTVSATYGAGGSVIAPAVAERLGVRWLDRMVSASTAERAGSGASPVEEGLSDREEAAMPGSRLFLYLARAAGVNVMAPPETIVDHNEDLRDRAEADIRTLCTDGGLLLGRAGAVVLAGRPSTFHVRLDGPPQRRLARAAEIEGVSLEDASRRMEETDRARTLYVRRLYRADPSDPSHYHLVIDTTVLPVDAVVELISSAARAFGAAGRAPAGW